MAKEEFILSLLENGKTVPTETVFDDLNKARDLAELYANTRTEDHQHIIVRDNTGFEWFRWIAPKPLEEENNE